MDLYLLIKLCQVNAFSIKSTVLDCGINQMGLIVDKMLK